MPKLLGLLLGIAIGAAFGAALVVLISPSTGSRLRDQVRRGYRDALDEANRISLQRRAELEAELKVKKPAAT